MSEARTGQILESDAIKFLKQYNIPYPEHGLALSGEEAANIATRLGYPVVLKIISPHVPHKSDVGGVALSVASPKEVYDTFKDMVLRVEKAVPGANIQGVLVCRQAEEGLEVIVGAKEDPVFGSAIMFGLGGIFTELLKDVTFRIAPLERIDANEMIREIKGYSLLTGLRGQQKLDTESLTDLIMAVSHLITDKPEIKELDLNPVRLFERGLIVLDVRIIIDR